MVQMSTKTIQVFAYFLTKAASNLNNYWVYVSL